MQQVALINYLNGVLEFLDNNDFTSAGDVKNIGSIKEVINNYYNNEYAKKDTFSLEEMNKTTDKHNKELYELQIKITELELDKQNLRYLVDSALNKT